MTEQKNTDNNSQGAPRQNAPRPQNRPHYSKSPARGGNARPPYRGHSSANSARPHARPAHNDTPSSEAPARVYTPLQQSIVANKGRDRRRPPSRGTTGPGGTAKTQETPMPAHRVKHNTGREKADTRRMVLNFPSTPTMAPIPPLKDGDIRIIFLGGVEEVGRNMTAIEYKNSIVIVDAGLQFKEASTPGIDFILPNTRYLEENKAKIKGLVITHGHLDHIGGIPYLMDRIGNPPIYTRLFSSLLIKRRQEEFPFVEPLNINLVEENARITMGDIHLSFFAVSHSIPDSMGVIIETPQGDVVCTGDLRLEHTDGVVSEAEDDVYEVFKKRNVLLLMTDSTNCENPGFSTSEQLVYNNIEEVIRTTPGRLIVSTFASQVDRMLKIIQLAEKYGKKIVVDGRSMKTNVEILKLANLLNPPKDLIIPIEDIDMYPPDRILALVTGAQGEEFAALMRIANKLHKYIRLNDRDSILMSASIVPGNEREAQRLKDNLSRQGAKIVHYKIMDIHSSGHANADELAWIHKHINPKFFIPVHGYHYMHRVHAEIAKRLVAPENIIIPDNGMIVEIQDNGAKMVALKESAPRNLVLVDGFSVGDIQEVVLRDRQMLSQDGIFIVVATLDTTTGKVIKSPDVISRGFVYLRESQELLRQARFLAKKTTEELAKGMRPIDFDYLKDGVTDAVARLLFQETAKRPIVIPVILSI
ncbi:MAG: ribonuclease J [bacterium]|nr:ribonuclease J [bacterium]